MSCQSIIHHLSRVLSLAEDARSVAKSIRFCTAVCIFSLVSKRNLRLMASKEILDTVGAVGQCVNQVASARTEERGTINVLNFSVQKHFQGT